jgi:hypothetical protein
MAMVYARNPSNSSVPSTVISSSGVADVALQRTVPGVTDVKAGAEVTHVAAVPSVRSTTIAIGAASTSVGEVPIEVISSVKKVRIEAGRPEGARTRRRPSRSTCWPRTSSGV